MSIRIMPQPADFFAQTTAQGEFQIGWSCYGRAQPLVMAAGVPMVMGVIVVCLYIWGQLNIIWLAATLGIIIMLTVALLWIARGMQARRKEPMILSVDTRSRRVMHTQVPALRNRVVHRIAHERWRVTDKRELGSVQALQGVIRVWTADAEDGDSIVLLTHHGIGSARLIKQLETACADAGFPFVAREMANDPDDAPDDVLQCGVNLDGGDKP
jgi:hypothetical protein